MSKPLSELLDLLQLEKLEEGLFRGQSENLGLPQVYGGQVIGQALSAARYTVDPDRTVHSFHSYFLYPGDSEKPIIYDVENLRDGRSFSTRRVKAVQNGRPIFYLTASYHGEAPGFEHQNTMPDVPGPENFASESELAATIEHKLPEKLKRAFCGEKPIEIRPVTVVNPLKPQKKSQNSTCGLKRMEKCQTISSSTNICLATPQTGVFWLLHCILMACH